MEEQLLTIDEEIVTTEELVDEWDNHIGDNVSF
jgi:hypothetical protein